MSEQDNLRSVLELQKEIAKLKAEDAEANKERIAELEKEVKLHTQSVEAIEASIRAQEKYIAGLSKIGTNLDSNILKREAAAELTRREIELAEKKLQLGGEAAAEGAREVTELKKRLDAQNAMLDASKEFNKSLDMSTGLSRKVTQAVLMAKVATEDMGAAMKSVMATSMRLADSAATSFIDKQVSSIHELLVSYDKQSKAFEKQYALGEASQDQIKSLYKEMNQYGASVEDVTKAYGALATGFTDFTMIAGTQQEAIAETATTLERAYGIANGDFASGMQNATKMMGMTSMQAEGYQRELAATAEALGVPPAQLAAKFASMGPQFSKFGTQAGKAFKDLARISKITGMEMEKVLAITNKFDTFEGAAEQAGQLNAALGGNFVNAMDLMMATDPAERFGMIRDAITSTGLSFDDMSYYQKQFYTNSLGLSDVGDLALMMSGNMDMMSGSSNESAAALIEQKQRAQDLMTVQEKINAMFADNSELMIDYLEHIESAAKLMQEHGETILKVAIGLKALSFGLGLYNGIQTILAARTVVSTESLIAQTAAQEALNSAQKRGTEITAGAGKAAGTAALNMLSFGAAVVLIGGGIYLAATGIGNMAESLKGLSGEALIATGVITGGIGAIIYALAGLAPATATAAAGLIPFGAAILLIGAGIGIAAAGIGQLIEGMGGIVESLVEFANAGGGIYEFATGVGALALSFYTLAGSLAALGNPLSILGVTTLSSVGNIMANKMEGVFTAMGNITKAKMLSIQTGFAEIAGSINEVSSLKIAPLAMAMTAVAAAPAAAATPAASAANATGSSASGAAKLTVNFVLDGQVFENKVIDITRAENGQLYLDCANERT